MLPHAVGKNRLLSGLEAEMGAGAEVMHQVVPLLEAPFHRCVVKSVEVVEEVVAVAPAPVQLAASPKAVVEVAVEVSDLVSFSILAEQRFRLSCSNSCFDKKLYGLKSLHENFTCAVVKCSLYH